MKKTAQIYSVKGFWQVHKFPAIIRIAFIVMNLYMNRWCE